MSRCCLLGLVLMPVRSDWYCLVENIDVSQDPCSDMMHEYCEHNDRGKANSHSTDPQAPGTMMTSRDDIVAVMH
jgi:hypothetical protein